MRACIVGLAVFFAAAGAAAQDAAPQPAGSPCEGLSCGGHGTCTELPSGPTCTCDEGYVPSASTGLECLPSEPAPQAAAAPAPAPATVPAPAPASGPEGWPYAFTPDEDASLRAAGAVFDPAERSVAERMQKRGFTSRQYVAAFADWKRHGSNRVDEIEDIAAFHYLGLPIGEYQGYSSSGRGRSGRVTDYYNSRIGGRGMKIAGGVMLGLGLVDLIGGIVFFTAKEGLADSYPDNTLGSDPDYWHVSGIVCMSTGGLMTAIGIPVLAVGVSRVNRWAPNGGFDDGPVEQMDGYRLDQADTRISLGVSPLVTRDAQGLGLTVLF
jgi:hypothetical protein